MSTLLRKNEETVAALMSLYLVFSLIVISSVDILWDHLVFSVVGTHEHFLVLYEHVPFFFIRCSSFAHLCCMSS